VTKRRRTGRRHSLQDLDRGLGKGTACALEGTPHLGLDPFDAVAADRVDDPYGGDDDLRSDAVAAGAREADGSGCQIVLAAHHAAATSAWRPAWARSKPASSPS